MEEDELLYREMYEEDPWYMGDYEEEEFEDNDVDEEYVEDDDWQEPMSREDEILHYLNEGEYDVDPFVERGVLYNNFHLLPGFNRAKLFWSLLDSPKNIALVNVRVYVDGEGFEYNAATGKWKSDRKKIMTERITKWLTKNIDVDYSDEEKIFRLHIPDEETAELYLIDQETDYYDINGKLYQYASETNVSEEYTDEKREKDSRLMKKAKRLTYKEAARRIVGGDFEMLPPELPKRHKKR